ncbi:hypothetical protein PTSG_12098 [Salpingoeca rosetta]|uniref:Uncharacterized protein n=1 Tax=Salpingoeca rosetta (strain ATCC 50818 / BSB-021) TaxID=946362 RepID=F2U797_SALR5|nr:uncharacterized protein PTSG_12098 [Salpingoeca rosetta]EGD83314.1 hypothetical protein PTSG_12098 [Salpingoeca rosetta]|eukprot:XP_004994818.1 hypothetical protein PTSG_12098 [Salpingoeca rosetta]
MMSVRGVFHVPHPNQPCVLSCLVSMMTSVDFFWLFCAPLSSPHVFLVLFILAIACWAAAASCAQAHGCFSSRRGKPRPCSVVASLRVVGGATRMASAWAVVSNQHTFF